MEPERCDTTDNLGRAGQTLWNTAIIKAGGRAKLKRTIRVWLPA
jgi:hypothetical protein